MTAVHKMGKDKTNLNNTQMIKITQAKDQIMRKSKKNTRAINPKRSLTCYQERKKKKSLKEFISQEPSWTLS